MIEATAPPSSTVASAWPHSWIHVVNSVNGYSASGPQGVRLTARQSAAAIHKRVVTLLRIPERRSFQ